jgi:glutamate 5-kinase
LLLNLKAFPVPSSFRQEIVATAHTVIVKVGTRVLTGRDGRLDQARITKLTEDLFSVVESGRRVALVTSGAVGSGMGQLGLAKRPANLGQLQAVAAVGQSHLMEAYDRGLRAHGLHAAQLLLTAEDLDDRGRYLNVRNTILALFEFGALPIINENDTVSTSELRTTFGDNDRLAAMVTNLVRAPLLILLSDVDGLYNGDPREPGAKLIPTVPRIDAQVQGLVRDRLTGMSKGGMASKIEAARIVTTAGEHVIIANGHRADTLQRILAGEEVGTLFVAQGQGISSWKRWVGFTAQPSGQLLLDDGACDAISQKGKSLLPAGIRDANGSFQQGDVVSLRNARGEEIGRGLTNYSAEDVHLIKGLKSDAIAGALGHCPYDEVVHRDNLAITTME